MSKNLDYCVKNVMIEQNDNSTSNYQRLLQLSYRAFSDLNLFVLPSFKTAYLKISDTFTVDLPSDYVYYVAIGVLDGDRIYTLTLNEDIALNRKVDDCGDIIPNEKINTSPSINDSPLAQGLSWSFSPSFRNGQYVGEQYGVAGGFNNAGYYKIDHEKQQIQFSNTIPQTEIVMEYKSNGLNCDGSVSVPEECVEPIIAFIHWKNVQNDKRIGLGEKTERRKEYYRQYNKLHQLINSFTKSEWEDNFYSGIISSPKR